MAIFVEVTENERIIHMHLRDIHPLLDYVASESAVYALSLIDIGLLALYGFSVRPIIQYYATVARSVCDS